MSTWLVAGLFDPFCGGAQGAPGGPHFPGGPPPHPPGGGTGPGPPGGPHGGTPHPPIPGGGAQLLGGPPGPLGPGPLPGAPNANTIVDDSKHQSQIIVCILFCLLTPNNVMHNGKYSKLPPFFHGASPGGPGGPPPGGPQLSGPLGGPPGLGPSNLCLGGNIGPGGPPGPLGGTPIGALGGPPIPGGPIGPPMANGALGGPPPNCAPAEGGAHLFASPGPLLQIILWVSKTIRRWKETTFHGESTPIIAKLLSLKVCWNLVVIMKILLKLWNSVKVVKFCQSCGVLSDLYGLVWSGRPNNEQWIGHNSQRSRWEWHLPWGWSFSTQLCHQTFILLVQLKQRKLKHVKICESSTR